MITIHIDEFLELDYDVCLSQPKELLFLPKKILPLESGIYSLTYLKNGVKKEIDIDVPFEESETIYEPLSFSSLRLKEQFITGADISSSLELIEAGAKYYENGKRKSFFKILMDHGVNLFRFKLFLNPKDSLGSFGGGKNDLEHTILLGQIATKLDIPFLLDIHYSDFWCDPAKQAIPREWEKMDATEITKKVYEYTYEVLNTLKSFKAFPTYIQVGNEITNGFLTHYFPNEFQDNSKYELCDDLISGKYPSVNFINYLRSGLKAVKDFDSKIETMIHIDQGCNKEYCEDFFQYLEKNTIDYDIIGLSFYPHISGSLEDFYENIKNLNQLFHKRIVVSETSIPFTSLDHPYLKSAFKLYHKELNYDLSPKGQAKFLIDVMKILNNANNGFGLIYWEPGWLPLENHGWARGELSCIADQALFDYEGNMLPSLDVFKESK